MSKRSWFYAFVCAVFCSAAVALQPTVRAGSINLGNAVKPTTATVTPTNTASASNATTNRGSALSKFSQGVVVPVSTNQSNNNSVSSSVLAELQAQIDALRTAQTTLADKQADLESSQSETSSVVESVTTQVQNISSTNSGLTSAVSDLQTSNSSLQSALSTIQNQTEALGDSLNSNIDSRLQYRGLLDSANNLAFATKNEINPETLALRIAANPTATATLSEKITPKEEDIQKIIKEDLIERQILDGTGNLNVEKKGQVQVTEETVTNALNNSTTFKNLVSEAATEKGFVTNTALDNKGFVTENSETITNLASKTEFENLKDKVEGDVNREGSLLYTIKENETIRRALKGDKGDKGDQGESANIDDVVDALKRDTDFINNTKAQDATTAWYEYCAKDNNLTSVVQQLYPSVTRCEDFTSDQFNKMMNGPKGQCLSWAVSPDNLQKNSGIGLRLTNIFGATIIDNLKSYHVGTKVLESSNLVNFVDACANKYDEIIKPDDPKTIEKAYCEAQAENYASGITNLTIIRKLYPSVSSCDQFTFEMYTAITSGAKAYCISLATNPDNLDATSGIGLKLEKTFGAGIVDTLKLSKLETPVNINGTRDAKNFVEACVENYDAIMAGKDAKSVEQVYCEAQAENYETGVTNLTIIQKFYSNVRNCTEFTAAMYAAITSGAKGYCKSLAQKPEDLDANSGIGAKLVKIFGSNIIENLQANKVSATVSNGTRAPKLFVEACEENYNEIMAGKDAKSIEQVYCEAQAENYAEGVTNLAIIRKLYPSVTSCDNFTIDMYTTITSGAKAYCLSLAQKPENLNATSGIGLKLEKTFGEGIVSALKASKLETMVNDTRTRTQKNFVEACEENYNEIMSGKDGENAKSIDQVYCEAQADNYPEGTTNLDLIKKLYSGVDTCADFTPEMYTAITSGAKAYCKSLAQKPEDLTADEGIGAKLEEVFGEGIVAVLKRDKLDAEASIATKSTEMTRGETKRTVKFVDACEQKYDEIMSGKNATPVWQLYCEAQADNYPEGTTNLTLIQKLFSDANIDSCKDFTKEQYAIMTAGAKEYCLNLNATFNNSVSVDDGIGLKLAKLYVEKNSKRSETVTLAQAKTALQTLQGKTAIARLDDKVFDGQSLFDACVDNYNKIMSGDDGKDAKSTEQTYCETNFVTVSALYSGLSTEEDCVNFTTEQYKAMMEGAKAYCLLIAKDFTDGRLNEDTGIGKRLNAELKISGSDEGIFSLKKRRSAVTLSEVLRTTKFNNNETFLEACEAKYNEIMSGKDGDDAETAWHAYCEMIDTSIDANNTTKNLDRIIKPLYGNSKTCDNFTSEEYNAITGGAKAYCLSLATNPAKLTNDNAVTKKLKKVFGNEIVTTLTNSGAGATVSSTKNRDGSTTQVKFVDECAARYDEIMGILPIETEFCETEDRLEKIIKPLYGDNMTCDTFTNAQYQAILGGAKAYCLSLVDDAKNNKLDANKGVGLKLEKILGSGIINRVKTSGAATELTISDTNDSTTTNFVKACEEKYNEIVAGDDALGFTYRSRVATYGDLPETCEQGDGYSVDDADQIEAWQGLLYICNCHTVNNVESCAFPARGTGVKFQGAKGEDGKSAEQAYCEANFSTVSALYTSIDNINKCSSFTTEQYKAMMEGAKAYCLLLAKDFADNKLVSTSGIGKKMNEKLKLGTSNDGIFSMSDKSLANILNSETKFNGSDDTFLTACEKNYNEIMTGKDAETVWHAYCEEIDTKINPNNTAKNLERIIKPLYGNSKTCDNFTSDEYNAIMGGAKAYCLSLATDPSKLSDSDSSITKKLKKTFGNDIVSKLNATGAGTTVVSTRNRDGSENEVKFVDECERRYDEIMAGDKGADAKSAEQTYCETNFTTVSALYSGINDISKCSEFTVAQYKAMMEGAKAYCLLLAQDFANNKLVSTSGIGKRMNEKLKVGTSTTNGIFSLADKSLSNVLTTKYNGDTDDFLSACEKTYNEIMSGKDGEKGEDAVTAWCKEHTTGSATGDAKLSAAKMVRAYDKLGGTLTAAAKINTTTGRFNSLEDCINAVKADPSLMGGDSAADEDFNEDNKGKTITLTQETKTTLEGKKTKFQKVVTEDNIDSKLTGSKVTAALTNAGFATSNSIKSDVTESVFTLSDFSKLLNSGGLKVNAAGEVKLADTTKNTDAANLVQKLTTAKAKDNSIKTTGLAATTSISTAVSNAAAAAAQANAQSVEGGISSEDCNHTDYMFWNIYGGEFKDGQYTGSCDQCPDGTDFKDPEGTSVTTRCVCPDTSEVPTYINGGWKCAPAGDEECLLQHGTFLRVGNGSGCEQCPKGTYFNDESMNPDYVQTYSEEHNGAQPPRCICEEKSATFNPSATGEGNDPWCVAASGSAQCAVNKMFWWTNSEGQDGRCVDCPDSAPFDPETSTCKCNDVPYAFNPHEGEQGVCQMCDDGEYDEETHTCKCEEGSTFDTLEWKCVENKE